LNNVKNKNEDCRESREEKMTNERQRRQRKKRLESSQTTHDSCFVIRFWKLDFYLFHQIQGQSLKKEKTFENIKYSRLAIVGTQCQHSVPLV